MPKTISGRRSAALLAGLVLAGTGTALRAEPGQTHTIAGTTSAQIVEPGAITNLAALRFGAFASPRANATMTIATSGTVNATGDVASTMNLYTATGGRGPARFRLKGLANRLFLPSSPSSMTISNGTRTMRIDQMSDNVSLLGLLNRNGEFEYRVGGRLNVGANQQVGVYTGEFEITVLFL